MKIKFYYSNGFCGCDEEETVDFPNATSIDDVEILQYGDDGLQCYTEYYMDDRFVDYPCEEDFECAEDFEEACYEAEDDYMENCEWWCEEVKEENE